LKLLVYVAGPYSNNDPLIVEENIQKHRDVAMWCIRHKIFYFCPVMNTVYFDDLEPKEFFLDMDIRIAWTCDALLLLPGWEQSEGATREYHFFARANKPIFYWPNEQELLLKWYY